MTQLINYKQLMYYESVKWIIISRKKDAHTMNMLNVIAHNELSFGEHLTESEVAGTFLS